LHVWLDLSRRPRPRSRKIALVAGPRLRHAAAEVRELGALLPQPTVLRGRAATAAATLAALDGAAVAHVACHGRFRSDSPLFSSLELDDGPLSAVELQRLRRAPDLLVLSACDLALSDRHPGDELLGFSAALLAMGTRTIVASVVPVPDAAARRLMLGFHRERMLGASPAAALATAQATVAGGRAAFAGFVCLGTG
jgi:CHAT domain-containing protein